MPNESSSQKSAGVWTMILTDVHFWVPAIVLLGGLVVLEVVVLDIALEISRTSAPWERARKRGAADR